MSKESPPPPRRHSRQFQGSMAVQSARWDKYGHGCRYLLQTSEVSCIATTIKAAGSRRKAECVILPRERAGTAPAHSTSVPCGWPRCPEGAFPSVERRKLSLSEAARWLAAARHSSTTYRHPAYCGRPCPSRSRAPSRLVHEVPFVSALRP